MRRKGLIYFLFIAFLFPISLYSQKKGFLEFTGRCIQNYSPLKDARITIYSGPTKVAEIKTPKNGQFMFDLDFGQDYKVVFAKSGCPEMYLFIQASKCPTEKIIFPTYEIDITFFDYRNAEINDLAFKKPITKVIYDSKGFFKDDEEYLTAFLSTIYNSENETKLNEELKILRQSQELLAIVKQEEEKEPSRFIEEESPISIKHLYYTEKKNRASLKSNPKANQASMKEMENEGIAQLKLFAKKELKRNTDNQNKSVKIQAEKEFLENAFTSAVAQKKLNADYKKIITALEQQAILKVRANELKNGIKNKSKIAAINRGLQVLELNALINQVATRHKFKKQSSVYTKNAENKMQVKTMVGIVTDITEESMKTTWEIIVNSNGQSEKYKKEKYNFGLVYFYKNNISISENQYHESLAQYNIPR